MTHKLVEAAALTRRYGSVDALLDVSFELEGPGVCGVLGPNGAGKTTLLDLLEGLSQPSSGSVRLFGSPVTSTNYPRRRVGVVLQREFVPDQVTVGEYAELFAALFGVSGGEARIMRQAELEARSKQRVARLSGGEAKRLFIAAALVHDPELLFLDEPTSELDPEHKRALGKLLRDLGRERTLLFTTHDLAEADQLSDHCLLLHQGRLRAAGSRRELLERTPGGQTLADAFFHFCAARVDRHGQLE